MRGTSSRASRALALDAGPMTPSGRHSGSNNATVTPEAWRTGDDGSPPASLPTTPTVTSAATIWWSSVMEAPCSRYASSRNPARLPAPDSISTSKPRSARRATSAGTIATLRSVEDRSRCTPSCTSGEQYLSWATWKRHVWCATACGGYDRRVGESGLRA